MDSFCIQMIKYHPDDQGILSAIAPGIALPPTSLWSNAGNDVYIIASIEDPVVIEVILAHLNNKMAYAENSLLPDCRASPSPSMDLPV